MTTTTVSILAITAWTTLLGVVGVLGREWILKQLEHYVQSKFDKELESYKDKLRVESECTIARLQSQLQISASERSIKLTQVFEEQAKIIAETYSKLVGLLDAARDYTTPITFQNTPSLDDRHAVLAARHKEFIDYYNPRKIYFPKETQVQIDSFLLKLVQVLRQFIDDVHQQGATHKAQTWAQTMDFIGKECPQVMENLDLELKQILGLLESQ